MNKQTVLVTGASGFVGRALVNDLLLNDHVVVRQSRQELPAKTHCSDVIKSIDSKTDWSEVLNGVTHIVHCAARVHMMVDKDENPLEAFREINTRGTINLARQAAQAGVNRFIFLSSIGVNGSATSGVPFNENDIPHPHNPYAQSKWEAEQALLDLADETGMEVVIIRPPLIYGPNAPGNFASLLKIIKNGLPLPLKSVKNKRAFIAIDNLVNFIQLTLTHTAAANQIFLISDGKDISVSTFIETITAELGYKSRLFYFPNTPVFLLAKLAGKSKMIEQLYGSLEIDITKARTLLDWKPVTSLAAQLNKITLNQ